MHIGDYWSAVDDMADNPEPTVIVQLSTGLWVKGIARRSDDDAGLQASVLIEYAEVATPLSAGLAQLGLERNGQLSLTIDAAHIVSVHRGY